MHYESEPLSKSRIGIVRGVPATDAHRYAPVDRSPIRAEQKPELRDIVRRTIEEKRIVTLEDLRIALAEFDLYPSRPTIKKIIDNESDVSVEKKYTGNYKYLVYTLLTPPKETSA